MNSYKNLDSGMQKLLRVWVSKRINVSEAEAYRRILNLAEEDLISIKKALYNEVVASGVLKK